MPPALAWRRAFALDQAVAGAVVLPRLFAQHSGLVNSPLLAIAERMFHGQISVFDLLTPD